MAEVSDQLKMLDGLVRYRYGDNVELMGAWGSAYSVVGPFRSDQAVGDESLRHNAADHGEQVERPVTRAKVWGDG